MCGIDVNVSLACSVVDRTNSTFPSHSYNPADEESTSRRSLVLRRGPDTQKSIYLEKECFRLDMFSAVLHIQGSQVCEQPLISNSTGSVLLWNGEFLNHGGSTSSDTALILEMLEQSGEVNVVLNEVEGPFAFVYYDNRAEKLWFGKDKQGRRSLLMGLHQSGLVVSSVGLLGGAEVPAGESVFCLDLRTGNLTARVWKDRNPFLQASFFSPSDYSPDLRDLQSALKEGIQRHMQATSVRRALGILFSGGLDSAIIASVAAEVFLSCDHSLTGIDLINVSCAKAESPDRATGLVTYADLLIRFPRHIFRFICVDIEPSELQAMEGHIAGLARPNDTLMDFNISSALWFGSRAKERVLNPSFAEDAEWPNLEKKIIASESVESAAENRRPKKCPDSIIKESVGKCLVCDRKKAKPGCLANACKICCRSTDCPAHTPIAAVHSEPYSVANFISPYIQEDNTSSDCRLLLIGHGADELFGGYGRHETRSKRIGLVGLRKEMLLDLSRLWRRNLGRDDRVLSDHGRDARHPFLDERVVSELSKYSIERMEPVEGQNKVVLRKLAREMLGLENACNFRKRAIQFGTRLASGSGKATKGTLVFQPTV